MPYDEVGAMNGLFAPALIRGDPTSEAAVQNWMDQNYQVTNPVVEQSRGAAPFNTGNVPGAVDPAALQAMAQGGKYDINSRRNAIAAQLAASQAAQQGGQSGGARGLRADQMMTPYGPITRNNDRNSPLIGLMGIDPETGPTFF
jgi:hypothetical protein